LNFKTEAFRSGTNSRRRRTVPISSRSAEQRPEFQLYGLDSNEF
jgi:hypothetical protein